MENESDYEKGYKKGRMDAADAVRAACSALGGDVSINIHFIASAAEG